MGAADIIKNTLIWILLLVLLPFPLVILFVYKSVITIIAKLSMRNLSTFRSSDIMATGDFVYSKPLLNIGVICKIDGHLDVNEVRQLFLTKLLEPKKSNGHPTNQNLYSYIHRFGGYNFKRAVGVDQLNIEEHIIEASLGQQSGQSEVEALSEFIKKFYYSPHTHGKPLWKVAIVQINDRQSMLFFCIHHSMADGYSLLYLFDQLTGNKTPVLTTPFKETLWDKIKLIAGAPSTMMSFLVSVGEAPKPMPSTGLDSKHHYALVTLDLAKVKRVRKQSGDGKTHVLAILFTLLGGVFRRLLVQRGKCKSEDDLPAFMYIASSLAWPSHPRNKMCNEWTVGSFRAPLQNPNRMERLLETEKHHNEFFALGINKLVKRLLVPLMGLFPACVGESMASPNSDVPMSASWAAIAAGSDYKLLGHPIENIFPVVGHTHPKMTWVTISMSHSNKMDVTILVNSEFVESCVEFNQVTNQMLNEELDALLEDCKGTTTKGKDKAS